MKTVTPALLTDLWSRKILDINSHREQKMKMKQRQVSLERGSCTYMEREGEEIL
jgi:hypothetical protein